MKSKHDVIDDDKAESLQTALNLIESGDSEHLREMLINDELSDINLDNGTGRKLLLAASNLQELVCLRVVLDYLESLKSIDQASDPSCRESSRISVDAASSSIDHCEEDDLKSLKYVNDIAADVNAAYCHGRNSVVYACYYNKLGGHDLIDLEVMKLLLDSGADVNTRCPKIIRGHDGGVTLDDSDYDINNNDNGFGDIMSSYYALLNHGPYCIEGDTLLLMACLNSIPMMRLLLEHGADVNAVDKGGYTPFMRVYTLSYGEHRSKAIDLLFQYDVDLNIPYHNNVEKHDSYPLIIACSRGDFGMIEGMLKHGADVNITDEYGDSALRSLLHGVTHYLNRNEKRSEILSCFKLLLDYGADVTAKDAWDKTVLDFVNPDSELGVLLRTYAVDLKPILK